VKKKFQLKEKRRKKKVAKIVNLCQVRPMTAPSMPSSLELLLGGAPDERGVNPAAQLLWRAPAPRSAVERSLCDLRPLPAATALGQRHSSPLALALSRAQGYASRLLIVFLFMSCFVRLCCFKGG
jgi:hypothetical protein